MNALGVFMLCALLAGAALDCALEILNCLHFKRKALEIPDCLRGVVSESSMLRSLDYAVANAKISILGTLLEILLWLALLLGGGFAAASKLLASFNLSFLSAGLLAVGGVFVLKRLAGIPCELLSSFVVERRFSFGTISFKTWLLDQAKGLLVGGAVFLLVAVPALLLIWRLPEIWWLPFWLLLLLVSIIGSWAAPVLIAPLFNKFEPLSDLAVSEAILEILKRGGVKAGSVMKMDASKRTLHGNAFFSGVGSGRRIVFYDTLLEKLDKDELVAVAAHEAGHWRLGHIPKMLAFSNALFLACLLIAWELVESGALLSAFGIPSGSAASGKAVSLALALFAFDALAWPLSPLIYWQAKRFERQADAFAAKLCGGGAFLSSALVKLTKDNLSNTRPHPLYSAFKLSHPPVPERVAAIAEASAENAAKGEAIS